MKGKEERRNLHPRNLNSLVNGSQVSFGLGAVSIFPDSSPTMSPEILDAARCLWSYHQLGHELSSADVILVFGSNDLRVAEHAAELWLRGLAPYLLFSGARGRMTMDWAETEAAAMARVAREKGVPEERILIEDRATNTGENIRFTRELLGGRGLAAATAIVVQKPYMERRTFAALGAQWPDLECRLSSPALDFDSYCGGELSVDFVIAAVVGDFQRILDYPALGFATAQEVPEEVMAAYRLLVAGGFDSRMR
ncbi:YdcF family protein [Haloferula sp. BvORR071]|uniref:YdcF family protein n=1 Tax=Haloferula sp. BvORR071 TaxID=1396141 RepID=UPI002240FB70|nr:YdcF family protein [Haloferula sp. BvORR071]